MSGSSNGSNAEGPVPASTVTSAGPCHRRALAVAAALVPDRSRTAPAGQRGGCAPPCLEVADSGLPGEAACEPPERFDTIHRYPLVLEIPRRRLHTDEYSPYLRYVKVVSAVTFEPLTAERRRAMTRQHLLDAAAIVFARDGFHGSTLDEVAATAGFTKGAVYSNFKSKDDLFLELLDDRVDRQFAVVTEIAGERLP